MIEEMVLRLKKRFPEITEEAINGMIQIGIINIKSCVIMMVKNDVNAYYKAGLGKTEAIQLAADNYGISYETAVNYVYKKKDIKSL